LSSLATRRTDNPEGGPHGQSSEEVRQAREEGQTRQRRNEEEGVLIMAKKPAKKSSKPVSEYGGKEKYSSKSAKAKHEGKESAKTEAKERFMAMIAKKKGKK
jgi:hypothetical protein